MAPFLASTSLAGVAGPGGGGNCERRFKEVAGDLLKWIDRGGASDFQLEASFSSAMKARLANYSVRCVGPGDQGYPVQVDGVAKDCLNEPVNGKLEITCDDSKFYSSLGESKDTALSQFRIVHHEFASGAGLEPHDGSESTYAFTNLLTDMEILLSVKPRAGAMAVKLVRIEESSAKKNSANGVQVRKTVKGYDDKNRLRMTLTEDSVIGRQDRFYSLVLVSENGGSYRSRGVGLPTGLRALGMTFTKEALAMQALFGRIEGESCRILLVSREGKLVDDDSCPF